MNTYELRTAIREWEQVDGEQDLEFPLRKEIESLTFELDRVKNTLASYRDVLRDVLK